MFYLRCSGLLLASALLLNSLAASADVVVREVLLRKKGADINVRVTVGNPAAAVQKGPVTVTLEVRENSGEPWKKIKTWQDIRQIKPGDKVSRDIFSQNSGELRNVASHIGWQARATVAAPGAKSAERIATNTGDTK